MHLKITQNGMQSLLVDEGRKGHQHQGYCQSGAMDEEAYWWANFLVANPHGTPCIEVVGELALICALHGTIAATGRDAVLYINQQQKNPYTSYRVKEGDEISLRSETLGSRTYLAVAGLWQVPRHLGSACTVTREHIGGLHNNGKPLQIGDGLEITVNNDTSRVFRSRSLPEKYWPSYDLTEPLRVVEGYQSDSFSGVAKQVFFTSDYKVTSDISRMGYRLSGTPVQSTQDSMYSEGIHLGAIQIPKDGQPIVMMKDRQTLGGYPKIGSVTPNDLTKLAQAVPGECVSFVREHSDNARARFLLQWQKRLRLSGDIQ